MENYKYLKEESYYSQRYDRHTIEECRYWEKSGVSKDWAEVEDESKKKKEAKIKEQVKVTLVVPTMLYVIKGERYANKDKTITEWMNADRQKDERLESTQPPKNIFCNNCSSIMTVMDKNFLLDRDKNDDGVIFMFECPMCKKRKGVWEDGREWKLKVVCDKCKGESVKESSSKKGNVITTIYLCQSCGCKKEDVWDLNEKLEPEKPDLNFGKDRQRFCLSKEDGDKYVEGMARLKQFGETMKEFGKKEEIKKKIANIKKLNIAELTKILNQAIEKNGYAKLELSKPEITRDVIINFIVQDSKTDRVEYDSIHNLKKILKTNLDNTNWRLMSEGVYYKLGILSGRLRGYENDEDLLKLKIKE